METRNNTGAGGENDKNGRKNREEKIESKGRGNGAKIKGEGR